MVRNIDLRRVPVARLLFGLRSIPDRVRGRAEPFWMEPGLDGMVSEDFPLLAEDHGVEWVVGSVGRFWQPRIEFLHVPQDEFAAFEQAGYGKLVWNLLVQPYGTSSSLVSIEVRVRVFDAGSLARFRRYWRLIGPFSALIRRQALALVRDDARRSARPPRTVPR
jgi:hypothetical protein